MLHLGEPRGYEPGAIIFAEGAAAEHLYVVEHGLVELVQHTRSGDPLRMAILGVGTLFGEGALFAASFRSATALAFRDTVAVEISNQRLREFLETRHAFAALLYRAMSKRLHQVVSDLDTDLRTLHHRLNREP